MLNSTEFAESAVGAQEGGDEGSDIDLDAMLDEALASVLDRDRDAAVQWKDKGNAALKQGDFEKAVSAYTKAIDLDPSNHVFYSNRSAAHLSNNYAAKALEDAELCIKANGSWAKGFTRKGAALHKLKRYDEAVEAYEEGLKTSPGDTALGRGLDDVLKAQSANKWAKLRQPSRGRSSELHRAALEGSAERTTALLSTGSFDIEQRDEHGMTPLMAAAMWGFLNVVGILLNEGASVIAADKKGCTALQLSVEGNYLALTKLLIKAGANLEAKNNQGYRVLHLSVRKFPVMTKLLIEAGADLEAKSKEDGSTPLSFATQENRLHAMGVLLEAGANPNCRRWDGATPLHAAAFCGHVDAIKVLLRWKADPLLHTAMKILSRVPDFFIPPPMDPCVPLDLAAEHGRTAAVRALVQEVGLRGCGGQSRGVIALRQATQQQHIETMAALVEAGVVDTGICLAAAAGSGCDKSVEFLLQQQHQARGITAYVNTQDRYNTPPLIYAIGVAGDSSPRIVRMLIDAGADTKFTILLRDDRGMLVLDTPLTFATRIHREKKLNGIPATEAQLRCLEAIRRLLQRAEATRDADDEANG